MPAPGLGGVGAITALQRGSESSVFVPSRPAVVISALCGLERTSRRRWAAIGSSLQWTQAIRRVGPSPRTRGVDRGLAPCVDGGLFRGVGEGGASEACGAAGGSCMGVRDTGGLHR